MPVAPSDSTMTVSWPPDPPSRKAGRIEQATGTNYTATGTLNPDATGNYIETGAFDGHAYYQRGDGSYHIWHDTADDKWKITVLLGILGTAYWKSQATTVESPYNPQGTATGIAFVEPTP